MTDFQQKRKIKSVIYSKLSLIILIIIIFFIAKATYNIYQKYKLSSNNYYAVKKDYDSLKDRRLMLESEIKRLKTDNGVEEEIRSKFNVAKPGETVVTVIDSSSSNLVNTANQNEGFWPSLWGVFKN